MLFSYNFEQWLVYVGIYNPNVKNIGKTVQYLVPFTMWYGKWNISVSKIKPSN